MFKKYVENKRPTVIFVSKEHQLYVERELLKLTPAYFHIQVTTIERYVLDLLKKHHFFNVSLLSKKTSLYAVKKSLELDGLQYFKDVQLTEGLINALLEAYEMMADLNIQQLPSTGKWVDLKRMYQAFCEEKKEECFMSELLYKAIPLVDERVCYVDLSYSSYSNALNAFFKKCHVEEIELEDLNGEREFYQVQFKHQEIELAISKISDGLKQGKHYCDFVVYVPNSSWYDDFLVRCPYPTHQQLSIVNNRDDAFMKAFYDFDIEKMKSLAYLEDDWFERMRNGTNKERMMLLEEVVSYHFEELSEDLDFETYRLFIKMLCPKPTYENDATLDCIELVTYQSPIVCHEFEEVICLGLNENEYPSKISESSLILNDEIVPYYPEGTPLLRNASLEWKVMDDLLKVSKHYTISSHFGALDGSECLSSLLYNQLSEGYPKKKFKMPLPSKIDEISASFDGMVEKVNDPKALYPRQGISPSELESFNGCPYRHFLSYGLNIRPRRRKLETKAKFGTLMHDLLDLCAPLFEGDFKEKLSALEKKYNIDSKEALDERLEALFKGMIATCPMELEGAEEEYMYSQFPSQFLNTLKILLFHMDSGEFRMAFHEEKFSYEVNGVNYSGRIDRADVYKNYLKIIDYKSSNKSLDIAMALEGFNVQMALYLEMLSKNKQLDKGALLYFNTSRRKLSDDGKMYLDGKTAEDFEKEYQMEGWILEEDKHEVMYGIDHNFPESRIAHIKYVKSRDAYSGRLMRKDVLERFIQEIFNHLHVLVERCFVEGDISIQPAGSDDLGTHMKVNPCQYCDYQDVCMRDPFYHEDRPIKLLEKEEMNQILEGGKQDGESHIDE